MAHGAEKDGENRDPSAGPMIPRQMTMMRIFVPTRPRWAWLAMLLVAPLCHAALDARQAAVPTPPAADASAETRLAGSVEHALKRTRDGQDFLEANKAKEGVVALESGLQYKILKTGDGKIPTIDDTITCRFRGTNIDGTEFASTDKSKPPVTVAVRRAIKGWSEALRMMPVGSKWQLFIPSTLAYGERGVVGRVGPNAAVIFELELVGIKKATKTATASPTNDAGGPSAIRVSFKLDSRLTRGMYLGDRWVSPPKFMSAAQVGKTVAIEARAERVDARGRIKPVAPIWVPADPEMVTVTPGAGNAATITVQRPGESTLRVTSHGVSSELTINAAYQNELLQVNISQK
jgi:FKBP-type peptidyl-prolyl cis-trans isomerase